MAADPDDVVIFFAGAYRTGAGYLYSEWEGCRHYSLAVSWVGTAQNDIFSSVDGFEENECNTVVIYQHANYGGGSMTCSPYCATLGWMDNQTSSFWAY